MKTLINTVLLAGLAAVMVTALMVGLDREAARQEKVRQWNCTHYGAFINKQAGQEVCPPTPQG